MKGKVIAFVLAFAMMMGMIPAYAGEFLDFPDVEGHWSYATLEQAYDDGLINGFEDGSLRPDSPITTAQMLKILCNTFGATQQADISELSIPTDAWYAEYAAKALYMGIIDSDTVGINDVTTRKEAFTLIGRAYQLTEADADLSVLEDFSDKNQLDTMEQKLAVASLVSDGYIQGYAGQLSCNSSITRAEFLTIIYRITDGRGTKLGVEGKSVIFSGDADFSGKSFDNIWFDCTASSLTLKRFEAKNVILRADSLLKFSPGNKTTIERLTMACSEGDYRYTNYVGVTVGTLVVGPGSGNFTLADKVGGFEITGSGRTVYINSSISKVAVSGNNNTIVVADGVAVGTIVLNGNGNTISPGASVTSLKIAGNGNTVTIAKDVAQTEITGNLNKLTVNGVASDIYVAGLNNELTGEGSAAKIVSYCRGLVSTLACADFTDNVDYGLDGAAIELSAPDILEAGYTLNVTANISAKYAGKACTGSWYIDGNLVSTANVTTGETPSLSIEHNYEYTKDMATSSEISFVLSYTSTSGEKQEISANKTITLQNYDKSYYMSGEYDRVLDLVKTGYIGDYTLAWAEANDYDDYDKEVWVNAKDYSSSSEYLIWVNIRYQRCNIFLGSQGEWQLLRSSIIGSGAGGCTPIGVFRTTYKQDGWFTSTYSVYPVVRFIENSGYAFHSRLYYPGGSSTILDPSVGFPVSHGCIRMYLEEVQWMYDNIPSGTTVVIY